MVSVYYNSAIADGNFDYNFAKAFFDGCDTPASFPDGVEWTLSGTWGDTIATGTATVTLNLVEITIPAGTVTYLPQRCNLVAYSGTEKIAQIFIHFINGNTI